MEYPKHDFHAVNPWIEYAALGKFRNLNSCKHSACISVKAVKLGTSLINPYSQLALVPLLLVFTLASFIWINRFIYKGFTAET